jgi:hypothetical protein
MPLIDLKSDLTWYGKTAPGDSGPQDIISRGVTDTVRVTKYLTTPSGIKFLLKQAGLQLTNPNIENSLGLPSINPRITPTKQFTPINLLANVATAGTGLRYSRHGISPIPTLGRYEQIVVLGRRSDVEKIYLNRLVNLKDELVTGKDNASRLTFSNITGGSAIARLSGVTGPKSVLGVGNTTIRLADRHEATYDKNIRARYKSNQYFHIGFQYLPNPKSDIYLVNKSELIDITSIDNLEQQSVDKTNKFLSLKKRFDTGQVRTNPARNETNNDKLLEWYNKQYFNLGFQYLPKSDSATNGDNTSNLTNLENIDTANITSFDKSSTFLSLRTRFGDGQVYTNPTRNDPNINNILEWYQKQLFKIDSQYASAESNSEKKSANSSNIDDANRNTKNIIDNWALDTTIQSDTPFSEIGTEYLKITVDNQIPESLKRDTPDTNNGNEALQKYAAVAYNRIPSTRLHSNAFNNFVLDQIDRRDLNGLLTGPILESNYNVQNIVSQFNYKHYSSRVAQNMRDITFNKDIVKFQIGGIKFRAYIDSISDSFSPSFNNEQPVGSPFSAVRYQSIERSISVSFKIAVLVREDLIETYRRMTQLQDLAYFSTGGQGFTAKTAQVVIGNLYNFTGIVESISYDWDSEIPWEIEEGSQLPLYCNASIDFKYLIPKPGFNI